MDSAQVKLYQHLGPTTLFGLKQCPMYGPRSSLAGSPYKPTFIALGDSFTWGHELQYHQVWPSLITQRLGWSHVNLAWGGSSIENMERMLIRSLEIQNIPHMAVLTYPWRSESTKWWLGDRWRRIKESGNTLVEQVNKIKKIVSQYPNVWFSTVWGYPTDLIDACRSIEKEFPNFKLNPVDWLDRAGPENHAGPISQSTFADFLIKEFFDKVNK